MSAQPTVIRSIPRRMAGAVILFALVAIGVAGGARPAAATNEFPPNPAAEVTNDCTYLGPTIHITLTNVGGADTAIFAITTATGTTSVSVAPNETKVIGAVFAEGETDTVHITSYGFDQSTEVGPGDCTQYQGEIVLSCDGTQPVLTATYENDSYVDSDVALVVGETGTVAPAGEKQEPLTLEVPDHEPFNATLSSELEGTFATLTGTPNCVPPVTTSTTSTSTTTSTVPVSVISVNTPNPPVANVTLARTGTNTWPLVGIGVTLIGLGVAFRRRAALHGRA